MQDLIEINDSHFIVDLMYAGLKHNMTGRAVYREIGLGNRALVHKDLWTCLQKLIPHLEQTRQKLKIFEAFRPPRAHRLLFAAIPQDGFFIPEAEKSPHCRATAVDVALTNADGTELAYPTLVDAYDETYAKEVQNGNLTGFFEHLKKASLDYQDPSILEAIVIDW